MPDDRYRFKVGDFECLVIKDTIMQLESQQFFSNVAKDVVKPLLKARGEKANKMQISTQALAIFSDDWVLIDAGIGQLATGNGQVAATLDDEEIRPEHIIVTHMHPDHYGGLINAQGEEAFGNVPVYVCQSEWRLAQSVDESQENPQRAATIRDQLHLIDRLFEPIECLNMSEILPGFSVLRLPGHTANHIGVLVESNGEALIYSSDAVVHPLYLEHLDWSCGFDALPDIARESRIKLAELALELDARVLSTHFPFPGLGKIERAGDGYRWQPVGL